MPPCITCRTTCVILPAILCFFVEVQKYIHPKASISHEASLVGYSCLRVDIFPYSAKKNIR